MHFMIVYRSQYMCAVLIKIFCRLYYYLFFQSGIVTKMR